MLFITVWFSMIDVDGIYKRTGLHEHFSQRRWLLFRNIAVKKIKTSIYWNMHCRKYNLSNEDLYVYLGIQLLSCTSQLPTLRFTNFNLDLISPFFFCVFLHNLLFYDWCRYSLLKNWSLWTFFSRQMSSFSKYIWKKSIYWNMHCRQ